MRSGLLVGMAIALLVQVIPAGPAAAPLTQDLTRQGLLDAIAEQEQLTAGAPYNHETRTGLALLYLRAGRPDDAVTQLQAALRIEPEHAPAHYNLGYTLVLLGRSEEAIAAYEQELADAKASANEIGNKARDAAKSAAEAERQKIEKKLGEQLAEAEKRIADIRDKAMADLGEIATETTQAVVSQLIGGSITKAEVTKALKASEGQEKSNG